MYKQQAILKEKIEAENDGLLKEKGFALRPILFRDYLAKLELIDVNQVVCARFNCYYSPKKQTFSLTFEKVFDESVKHLLTHVFQDPGTPFHEASTPEKGLAQDTHHDTADDQAVATKYQAYVDGSYIDSKTGYGAIILRLGIPIKKLYGRLKGSEDLRQVGGELQAVKEVLTYCAQNDIGEIAIFYDYTGIREWAEDNWKANKTITKSYKAFMKQNTVTVHWQKVKAHSGNIFNEMADRLAKKAATGQVDSGS